VEFRKHARVTEELIVTRVVIHRTKQVRGTVCRYEVYVVEDGVNVETIRDRDPQAQGTDNEHHGARP
jgi:stress response protein YsnF